MFKDVQKILIFKLCCLGDSIFITPAIKSLRKNFPDAEIIYAHSEWIQPIMDYIPGIDGTILFENVYSKNIFKKIAGTLKFIARVRKENFTLAFNGHRSNMLSLILMLAGIPYRLGFKGTKYLTHTGEFEKTIPEFHRYLAILTGNGLRADDKVPELKKPPMQMLREKAGFPPHEKIVGIFPFGGVNPGTKMNIKQWPLENYFKLAEKINKEFPGIKIIFFEGRVNEHITLPQGLNAEKRTVSIELIGCCNHFISADTGSLHIAAALKVSTLGIFGPSDPRLVAPANYNGTGYRHKTIWKQHSCGPCYTPDTAIDRSNKKHWKDGEFICHTGTHLCIKSITPGEVYSELVQLLQQP